MKIFGGLSTTVKRMVIPNRPYATDIVVIEDQDGTLKSTKFYLTLGRSLKTFSEDIFIEIRVNGDLIPGINMKISHSGKINK